eukprot:209942_1
MMAATCTKIRDLVALLPDDASTEQIKDVKQRFLSLADMLEREKLSHLNNTSRDIDNLLDEIDETEHKHAVKAKLPKREHTKMIERIDSAFWDCLRSPDIWKYVPFKQRAMQDATFVMIFIKPLNMAHLDYTPPLQTDNVNENDLINLFHEVPDEYFKEKDDMKVITGINRNDFAEWLMNYGQNQQNPNQKTWKIIYEKILGVVYWEAMSEMDELDEMTKHYADYKRYIDINRRSNEGGETILHLVVRGSRNLQIIEWVLSIPGLNEGIKDYKGMTAMDYARKDGKWDIVAKLAFASMSNKMRQKADEQIAKLDRNKGIVKQWFRFYQVNDSGSDEYKSMIKMVESVKTLIQNKLPFSDDLLLMCFHFEMTQHGNDPLKCSLWQCIHDTLNDVLRIPLNRRNWLWFKQYIFGSSLWYQHVKGDEKLLYDLLIEMVSTQLQAQVNYLKPHIDALENKTEDIQQDDSWEKLKNYPEFIVTDNPEGLRQDECIERGTGRELLPFPLRPAFSNDQLTKLSANVTEFNCHNQYDVHGYLSKLILTAHSLNPIFHEAMRIILNIDDQDRNDQYSLKYLEGPVKKLSRSQAKSETDYSHCSYPTTAKVVDFIRCCCVYKNANNLLNGIDKFVQTIEGNAQSTETKPICLSTKCERKMKLCSITNMKEIRHNRKRHYCQLCYNKLDSELQVIDSKIFLCDADVHAEDVVLLCIPCGKKRIVKTRCLKKILRVKNMFLDNKRENGDNWDLYKYADIKMGILMEYDGQSMVVEVQFLLDWILKAKSLGHGLYEIDRNKDFIFDVNAIKNIGFSAGNDDNVDSMIKKAVISGDENQLATLILNEAPVDLINADQTKNSLLHHAIEKKHKKIMQLLLDTMRNDAAFGTFINYQGEDDRTPLLQCKHQNNVQFMKILLSYSEVDVNVKDESGQTILFKCIQNGDNGSREEKDIFNMIANDNRCDWNFVNHESKQNMLHAACQGCGVDIVTKVWNMGYFGINDKCQELKYTALMYACDVQLGGYKRKKDNSEVVQFLLGLQDIDVNAIDAYGYTAMDLCIRSNHITAINILYGKKSESKVNKFVEAAGVNVAMCQLVMRLWPQIDINGVDNDGQPAIVKAVHNRDVEVLKHILSLPGIAVNKPDPMGMTAWLMACWMGELEHAQILYQAKDVDLNVITKRNRNAMDLAIDGEDKKKINWLKSNGFTKSNKK